jgi:hypothetical protein
MIKTEDSVKRPDETEMTPRELDLAVHIERFVGMCDDKVDLPSVWRDFSTLRLKGYTEIAA